MKTCFLFIILSWILTFSACTNTSTLYSTTKTNNTYNTYPTVGFITKIPIPAHKKPIQILFSHENPKDKAYIKLATLEEVVNERVAYGTSIKKLESAAQRIGADALIILGKEHTKQPINDSEGVPLYYLNQKHISTVAIKYIRNIKNIHLLPKAVICNKYDAATQTYKSLITKQLNIGNISQRIDPYYDQFIYNFSLQYILEEKNERWAYIQKNGLVTNRQFNKDAIYTIQYDSLNRVKKVISRYADTKFFYNIANQITEKQIYGKKQVLVPNHRGKKKYRTIKQGIIRREILKYDKQGRLIEKEIFRIDKRKETPWLKVTYPDFYTQEDLNALSNDNYVE